MWLLRHHDDFSSGGAPGAVHSGMNNAAATRKPATSALASALVEGASTTCIALRAMAAALEALECPVQAAIAADLYALADRHEAAEEATR